MAHRRLLALIFLGLLMVTVQRPMTTQAATINVSTSAELIAAMAAAQSGDVIDMATGTYQLTEVNNTELGATGLPVIKKDLTINGNGSTIQRVAGSPAFRIMLINEVGISVTLNNLTITGGQTDGTTVLERSGGGLNNNISRTVTLNNVSFVGNQTVMDGGGGGLYHSGNMLSMNGGTVGANSSLKGGGIYLYKASNLYNVLIDDNQIFPGGRGGGLYASSTDITHLESIVISNNLGHGMYVDTGAVYLLNSRVTNNSGVSEGAGIYINGWTVISYGSLIDNNSASSVGGGLYTRLGSGRISLYSSTVSNNRAPAAAGIYNAGAVGLYQTTIANNISADPANLHNVGNATFNGSILYAPTGVNCSGTGTYTSVNYSISNDATCSLTSIGDLQNTDPKIGPLVNNGGLFPSHALLVDSPAIDRVVDFTKMAYVIGSAQDGRGSGYARISGGAMDSGAFEIQQETCPSFPVLVDTPSALSLALTCFNTVTAPGTYTITLTNDITLTNNLPFIGNSDLNRAVMLVLDGNGFGLNGNNLYRSGTSIYPPTNVTFRNIKFVNGLSNNSGSTNVFRGGALSIVAPVFSRTGTVIVEDAFFEANVSSNGSGAVANNGANLLISRSMFDSNVGNVGGALYNQSETLVIDNSIFTGNKALGGGALYLRGGRITLDRTTVDNNEALSIYSGHQGGGIYAISDVYNPTHLTVRDSIISNNRANLNAGGIVMHYNSTLNLINSTVTGNYITGNQTLGAGGLNFLGDDFHTIRGSTIVDNASINNNSYNINLKATVNIANTIISNRSGTNCTRSIFGGGYIVSGGYNIISDASCGTPTTGDQFNTDPQLAPLADNGGPTLTHALLPGSPAIDAGSTTLVSSLGITTDQRGAGFPRIRGARVDVGAFESPGVVGVTLSKSSVEVTEGGATDTYTVVLDGPPYADVMVSLSGGTQASVSPNTLTFTPTDWNTPQTVTVTTVDDRVVEGDHAAAISHAVSSTDVNYHAFIIPSVAVSVTDNDSASYRITDASAQSSSSGPESVTTVALRIAVEAVGTGTGDWDFALPFDVGFSVTGGTAIGGGVDYDLPSTSVSFTPGMTFTDNGVTFHEVTLTIIDNDIDDDDKTLIITAADNETGTNGSYDLLINPAEIRDYTYTILNDDTAGVIVSPATVEVSESGTTDSYTVALNTQPTADVTVNIISDAQVTTNPVSLVFTSADWNVPQTVTVSAVDDGIPENDHTGSVSHTVTSADAIYNGIAAASVTATISDNDIPSLITSVSALDVSEGGDSVTYILALGSQPASEVTIEVSSEAGETWITPMSLTFTPTGPTAWSIPQTITVSAIDDDDFEGSQTDIITHEIVAPAAADYQWLTAAININITDNDEPTNLIANPGFEFFTEVPKQPASWVGRGLTRNDRRLCNAQATFSGLCGFQFKPDGSPMTGSRELRQRNNFILSSVNHEVLMFSARVRANNLPTGARVMIVVNYNDGSGRVDRLIVPIEGGTYGYTEISGTLDLYSPSVASIITRIRVGNRTGRLRLDDLFLVLVPEDTLSAGADNQRSDDGLFTLPEAPDGFRSGN